MSSEKPQRDSVQTGSSLQELNVIFKLEDKLFSVPSDQVITIDLVKDIRPLPQSKPNTRGIIHWRNKVLPLIDLRQIFGMRPYREVMRELGEEMRHHKEQHDKWVAEFHQCVAEGREFESSIDYEQCPLTLWIRNFKSEDMILASYVREIESPHKVVHSLIKRARAKIKAGPEKAQNILDEIQSEITLLEKNYNEALSYFGENLKELFLYVSNTQNKEEFAICVDSVQAVAMVEHCHHIPIVEEAPSHLTKFLSHIAKLPDQDDIIMQLDLNSLK